jgi:hypothetical protein
VNALDRAPICFWDGKCFRLNRDADAPIHLVPAVRAAPLFWFLDSCAAIPLAHNAFGTNTSYVYGLLAGAAVSVIGPYVVQASTVWRSAIYEGLLMTGATTGEAAQAVGRLSPREAGFYSYVLVGSPDLRLVEPRIVRPSDGNGLTYILRGRGASAFRLRLPEHAPTATGVVADDGAHVWGDAFAQVIEPGQERELLVLLDPPRDVDGFVTLACTGKKDADFVQEAEEVTRRLRVLSL